MTWQAMLTISITLVIFYLVFGLVLTPHAWMMYKDIGSKTSPWRKLNTRFEESHPVSFRLYVALLWPLILVLTVLAGIFIHLPAVIIKYFKYGYDGEPTTQPSQEVAAPTPTVSDSPKHTDAAKAIGVAAGLAVLFGIGIATRKRT